VVPPAVTGLSVPSEVAGKGVAVYLRSTRIESPVAGVAGLLAVTPGSERTATKVGQPPGG
jgi:hypothetical protein